MIDGWRFRATANKARTNFSPSPTNLLVKVAAKLRRFGNYLWKVLGKINKHTRNTKEASRAFGSNSASHCGLKHNVL